MSMTKRGGEALGYPSFEEDETRVLDAAEERQLLLLL